MGSIGPIFVSSPVNSNEKQTPRVRQLVKHMLRWETVFWRKPPRTCSRLQQPQQQQQYISDIGLTLSACMVLSIFRHCSQTMYRAYIFSFFCKLSVRSWPL